MQLLRQIQMLDLIGELELGLVEENVFWNSNKSSLNKEKKKTKKEKVKVKFEVKKQK